MNDLKLIGHLVSTHGLKGEAKVFFITTDIANKFKIGNEVSILKVDKTIIIAKISSIRIIPAGYGLVGFENFNTIEKVQPLIKGDIFAPNTLSKETYDLVNLIGMEVYNENSIKIGTVSDFVIIAKKAYLIVNSNYIPFIMKLFIESVDEEKRIVKLTVKGEEVYKNA